MTQIHVCFYASARSETVQSTVYAGLPAELRPRVPINAPGEMISSGAFDISTDWEALGALFDRDGVIVVSNLSTDDTSVALYIGRAVANPPRHDLLLGGGQRAYGVQLGQAVMAHVQQPIA